MTTVDAGPFTTHTGHVMTSPRLLTDCVPRMLLAPKVNGYVHGNHDGGAVPVHDSTKSAVCIQNGHGQWIDNTAFAMPSTIMPFASSTPRPAITIPAISRSEVSGRVTRSRPLPRAGSMRHAHAFNAANNAVSSSASNIIGKVMSRASYCTSRTRVPGANGTESSVMRYGGENRPVIIRSTITLVDSSSGK